MPTEIKIREQSLIAKLAAKKLKCSRVAIVIGNTIHLHNTSTASFLQNRRWLLHELKHVAQYQQHGIIQFLWKYLTESIKSGYYNNKFEIEARHSEQDAGLLKEFTIKGHTLPA